MYSFEEQVDMIYGECQKDSMRAKNLKIYTLNNNCTTFALNII